MPQRPDTLETVLLAVELLRRIPRGRKITASELHRQLKDAGIERSERTIQRQLEMLSSHFEIERDERSKPYGYRWLLIRPCEVLSRVANVTILEVANNALRVLLQHRHVIIGSLA